MLSNHFANLDATADCGDTTDEDMPLVPNTRARTRRMSSSLSASTTASSSPDKRETRTLFSKPVPRSFSRPGPKMGSWVADPSKPIAVVDATGKTMVIYQAPRRGSPRSTSRNHSRLGSSVSSVNGTAPGTPHNGFADDSESDNRELSSVLGSMFSGFANTAGSLNPSQIIGPPEAFLPFVDVNGVVLEQEDDDEDDSEIDLTQALPPPPRAPAKSSSSSSLPSSSPQFSLCRRCCSARSTGC